MKRSGARFIAPDYADLQGFMDKAKAPSTHSIESIVEWPLYESFAYEASAFRSPFQPIVQLESGGLSKVNAHALQPDQARAKHILEGFPIENLEMVGVLSNSRGSYALLRSSNGVYRVAVGDYVGVNHGRVHAITASRIEVVEIIADAEEGWLEQSHTLVLQER